MRSLADMLCEAAIKGQLFEMTGEEEAFEEAVGALNGLFPHHVFDVVAILQCGEESCAACVMERGEAEWR